jgi:hypothetical protein
VTGVPETIVRFFSYFTILTNSLVAIYFVVSGLAGKSRLGKFFNRASVVTAITVYITIVGLVYQFILRNTWNPTGLQMIIDEMLHSVIPAGFILYWFFLTPKTDLSWKNVPSWMIYPIVYFILVVIRGELSGFYPYPFVDVAQLGLQRVLVNAGVIVIVFLILSLLFVFVARRRAMAT